MIQGLVANMLSSRDMRNKVSNACTIIGGPIALRLVFDDPNVLGGTAIKRTNLVMIDLADVEKHIKNATAVAPPGTSPEAIANAIATATFGYLIAMLAHEIDHLRETGTGPFAGHHSDPGQGAPDGDLTGGAVRDESLVLNELGVRSFREFYTVIHEGKAVIQVDVGGIKVNFDPASSVTATAIGPPSGERRFVAGDQAALNQVEDRCCGCDNAACPPGKTEAKYDLALLQELNREFGYDGPVTYDLGAFRLEAELPYRRAVAEALATDLYFRTGRTGSFNRNPSFVRQQRK